MQRDLTELKKLEEYLINHRITYERFDEEKETDEKDRIINTERHQICVPDYETCKWDVVCHEGSYGSERGLLEIYGSIVEDTAGDTVVGWLTADDVIKRIEENENKNHRN